MSDESQFDDPTEVVDSAAPSANPYEGLISNSYPSDFRAGFVGVVGRPNVGKSTLTNALVGRKVAITSGRPETTRHSVRGVIHDPNFQIVLVDTPGYHRPRTLLGERLNDMVREAFLGVDAVAFCLPADQKVGPGDQFIAAQLRELKLPLVAIATKIDRVDEARLLAHLQDIDQLADFAHIVPVSARTGRGLERLVRVLSETLPTSPPLYPADMLTDESDETMIAELIREAALEGVREELPHSLAVQVEEIIEREPKPGQKRQPMLDIHVNIFVERDSQKAIIIGRGGKRLKHVGSVSREQIETLLGRRVYLDLHVRTAKDWQSDPKMLTRLGF